MLKHLTRGILLATLALPALAEGIMIKDGYVRTARPGAPNAAAFMQIMNTTATADRLIAVRAEGVRKPELHTHDINPETGVARMRPVEGGFAIPAGGMHSLARGGDHVMLMGLETPLSDGQTVELTLIFETAGEVPLSLTVDNQRAPKAGHGHGHSGHSMAPKTN